MVKLHIKKGDESQFLYETTVELPIDELVKDVCAIHNGRLKVQRICAEMEELAEHGITLPPNMQGLTEEQVEELKLKDEWADKCVPQGGVRENKDPIGRRNGQAPTEKMAEMMKKTTKEAKDMISKKKAEANVCVTQTTVKEALDILRGAVMIVYPMNLPPHENVRLELENQEDLTGTQVLCTLRFMAKADFFSEVGDIHGISKSSVSVFLPRVCRALNAFLHIDFPTDAQTLLKMKEGFYVIAHFPNVVGAIDGTLIPIRGMNGEDEPVYVCRKNFHALNVQGVVDANMRFININCRFPGSTHDAYVFQHSSIPGILETLPGGGWLLGDSGYPLKDYLMTPFINPSTPAEERYNAAHCKTRNVVERTFGVLKARFRCLHSSGGYLPFKPEKCALVVETCMKLHNKAINERVPLRNGGAVANQHNNAVYQGAAPLRARELRQQLASRF